MKLIVEVTPEDEPNSPREYFYHSLRADIIHDDELMECLAAGVVFQKGWIPDSVDFEWRVEEE